MMRTQQWNHGLGKIHLEVSHRQLRRTHIDNGNAIFDFGKRSHRCKRSGKLDGIGDSSKVRVGLQQRSSWTMSWCMSSVYLHPIRPFPSRKFHPQRVYPHPLFFLLLQTICHSESVCPEFFALSTLASAFLWKSLSMINFSSLFFALLHHLLTMWGSASPSSLLHRHSSCNFQWSSLCEDSTNSPSMLTELHAATFLMVSSKPHLHEEATCRAVYQSMSSKSFFSVSEEPFHRSSIL